MTARSASGAGGRVWITGTPDEVRLGDPSSGALFIDRDTDGVGRVGQVHPVLPTLALDLHLLGFDVGVENDVVFVLQLRDDLAHQRLLSRAAATKPWSRSK